MNFYQILLKIKLGTINRNLTWYENLFASFLSGARNLFAKLLKIKGNTVVWNQHCSANGSSINAFGLIGGITNGKLTLTGTFTGSSSSQIRLSYVNETMPQNHKVLFGISDSKCRLRPQGIDTYTGTSNYLIYTGNSSSVYDPVLNTYGYSNGDSVNIDAYIIICDLTQMFGSGNEPSTVDEFRKLYSLDYYASNSGSLLSFNGTGIKTTGKNRAYLEQGTLNFNSDGSEAPSTSRVRTNFIPVEEATDYVASSESNGWIIKNGCCYDANFNYLGYNIYPKPDNGRFSSTLQSTEWKPNLKYVRFIYGNPTNTNCTPDDYWYQFEQNTTPTDYVPYTTSTTSLPVSTYFPTGMKDIDGKTYGKVYDELTPSKAITRIGSVNLGDLTWVYDSTYQRFNTALSTSAKIIDRPRVASIKCAKFECITDGRSISQVPDKAIYRGTNYDLSVHDSAYNDATVFKNAMNGVYLFYELNNYGETDISPSLNLSYEIEWGGTEQLLPENTSTPTTSPILADINYPDGERDDQYFTYREITQTNVLLGKSLNTIMGREVEFNREALDILMKGE